ncbi:7077_t:CDS:2, partial [Gigaspora rosea]
ELSTNIAKDLINNTLLNIAMCEHVGQNKFRKLSTNSFNIAEELINNTLFNILDLQDKILTKILTKVMKKTKPFDRKCQFTKNFAKCRPV